MAVAMRYYDEAQGALAAIEVWKGGEGMAERGKRRAPGAGMQSAAQRSLALTPEVARMRTRGFGARLEELYMRAGKWVGYHLDHDTPGHDTMSAIVEASEQDGYPISRRQLYNLRGLMDPRQAAARKEVSLGTIWYLLLRWGSDMPAAWGFLAGRGEDEALPGTATTAQAEARALGDVYLSLPPDLADQLVLTARVLVQQAEARGEHPRRRGGTVREEPTE